MKKGINDYETHQKRKERMKKKAILFGTVGLLVLALIISPVFAQETGEKKSKTSAGLLLSISPAVQFLGTPTIICEQTLSTNWGIEGRLYLGYTTTLQGYIKRYLKPNLWIGSGIGTVSGLFKGTIISFGIGYKKSLESVLSKLGISSNSRLFSRTDMQLGFEIHWFSGELEGSQTQLSSMGVFGAVVYRF